MSIIAPAMKSGSLLALNQVSWGPLYAAVLNLLGSTGTILPFGDPNHGQPNATTFTTVGEEQVTFTWSEAPSAFDTGLDLTSPDSFQGTIPTLTFNGTDEEADSPDAAYWSRVLTSASWGAWVNLTDATSSSIMSKFTTTGNLREWRFITTSGDDLQVILADENAASNETIDTVTNTTLVQSVWSFLAGTYDGTADATGINLFLDGALAASTDTDAANFVSMRDTNSTVELGMANGTDFFDGQMAGGPLGPFFTQTVLSADAMLRLYQLGRAALGV